MTTTPPVPDPEVAQPPKRRPLRAMLVGAVALALVGGGIAAAGLYFGWFGGSGGAHPYDVMPSSTVAYVQVDLNPSLEQKTQAWSFLHDLPEVQAVTLGQPDPKRLLWGLRDRLWVGSTWTDYETDLASWLGDRFGVGLLANPTDPNHEAILITAIQVTDQAKATAKLQEWLDATGNTSYEVSTRDGYAVITASSTAGFVHAEQSKGVLGTNQRFRADLASVGAAGWMAGWLDSGQLAAGSPTPSDEPGREAFALRFSGDTMEFVGKTLGTNHPLANGSGQLGALPATTGTAVCVTGAIKGVPPLPFPLPLPQVSRPWPKGGLNAAETAALLGKGVCVSAPASQPPGFFTAPEVLGLRIVADDPGRAREVLRKVSSDILPGHRLEADQLDGSVLTAATSPDYLAELAGPGDPLSSRAVFTRAVPESARAALAFFLDLEPFWRWFAEPGSPYEQFVTSLKAVGGEYFDEGSGNGSWSVRVVRA